MEKLILSFCVRRRNSFIDGTYLTNEVFNYMSHLHTFIFDIVSEDTGINVHPKPCSDDIRRTFIENGHHADCYINYYRNERGRCHVYSLPFTMGRIHYISSRFPGGVFINVRVLRVCDIVRPFENKFFATISRSFPLLTKLTVSNTTEQLGKPLYHLNKSKETSSFIEYSHLVELHLYYAHIDYVEQFLCRLNTSLPSLSILHVQYDHLTTVTKNFTRDVTRINCAEVKRINFALFIQLVHSRNFYHYFPSLS
jgi:hypothetical protein